MGIVGTFINGMAILLHDITSIASPSLPAYGSYSYTLIVQIGDICNISQKFHLRFFFLASQNLFLIKLSILIKKIHGKKEAASGDLNIRKFGEERKKKRLLQCTSGFHLIP